MHVIHYIPRRLTPYVYYPTSREQPRYLVIPRSVYEDQRARFEARLDAIRRFAFGDDRCRSQVMLEYFGEADAPECGHCDVCRERLRREPKAEMRNGLVERIINLVADAREISLSDLLDVFPTRRRQVVEILRQLSEEGKFQINGDKILHID